MKTIHSLIEKDKALLQELFGVLDEVLHKRGKQLSHLQFARPTEQGWSFFKGKEIHWDILEDMTHQTSKRHPHCHRAVIADTLSQLINLPEHEIRALQMLL